MIENTIKRKAAGKLRYLFMVLALFFIATALFSGNKTFIVLAVVLFIIAIGLFVYSFIAREKLYNEIRKDAMGNKFIEIRDKIMIIPLIILLIFLAIYFINNILPMIKK